MWVHASWPNERSPNLCVNETVHTGYCRRVRALSSSCGTERLGRCPCLLSPHQLGLHTGRNEWGTLGAAHGRAELRRLDQKVEVEAEVETEVEVEVEQTDLGEVDSGEGQCPWHHRHGTLRVEDPV